MKEYYIVINTVKQGPFTIGELRKKTIPHDSFIWEESFEDWKLAKEVPEIAEIIKSKIEDNSEGNDSLSKETLMANPQTRSEIQNSTQELDKLKPENKKNSFIENKALLIPLTFIILIVAIILAWNNRFSDSKKTRLTADIVKKSDIKKTPKSENVKETPSDYSYYNSGISSLNLKEYEKAIDQFTNAIKLSKGNSTFFSKCYFYRGHCHFIKGQSMAAISDFNNIINHNKDFDKYIEAHYWRGSAYHATGEPEFKEKSFSDLEFYIKNEKAENFSKHDDAFYYRRGDLYLYFEEYEKAISDFDKHTELAPNSKLTINKRKEAIKKRDKPRTTVIVTKTKK